MKIHLLRKLIRIAAILMLFAAAGVGQTEAEVKEALIKGLPLIEQGRFGEAIPHLEVLVRAAPDDAEMRFVYGVALLTKSKQIDDNTLGKKLSADALEQFKAAKRLGMNDPRLDSFIQLLGGGAPAPPDGLSEAQKVMSQAEVQFAQSNFDEALVLYQKALALDPKLYDAALYSGDVYVKRQDWDNAEKWYQKAIAINPERETGYRYSATPLMRQKKYDLARDRYIEAFVAEPYSEFSPRGISQWAEVTGTKLGHPVVKFPTDADLAAPPPTAPVAGAALAWNAYIATRAEWRKAKFAAAFPAEKAYRHSLKEEADAIRSALRIVAEKKIDDVQLQLLQKIETAGVLEAYVLMAIPDRGIAQDHRSYWRDNRPRLRQYVMTFVIQK